MLERPPQSRQEARRARQARYARRQRDGLGVYAVEASAAVLNALIALGWLKECDAGDRAQVGRAIAAVLTELAEHRKKG